MENNTPEVFGNLTLLTKTENITCYTTRVTVEVSKVVIGSAPGIDKVEAAYFLKEAAHQLLYGKAL